MANGTIYADDQPVTLVELRGRLAAMKGKNGVVWYYREAAESEPHPNAMQAMKLVVENQLAITLSTKPDFSDAIGADGSPHPR